VAEVHEGGCSCGAVRYRVRNKPVRTGVCHCTFCQRRTGSAFGIGAYFREQDVEILSGELKTYEHRSDESGRKLWMQFCANCGSTVTWTLELLPGTRAIAGGSFDDPNWLKIERHGWTRSAQRWVALPHDVEVFEKSTLQQPLQVR
jgi:hypothetical protein